MTRAELLDLEKNLLRHHRDLRRQEIFGNLIALGGILLLGGLLAALVMSDVPGPAEETPAAEEVR